MRQAPATGGGDERVPSWAQAADMQCPKPSHLLPPTPSPAPLPIPPSLEHNFEFYWNDMLNCERAEASEVAETWARGWRPRAPLSDLPRTCTASALVYHGCR